MDANFHREVGDLDRVAEARDAELTVFYFCRIVESCVARHAAYATTRFPKPCYRRGGRGASALVDGIPACAEMAAQAAIPACYASRIANAV
jgi:hypothetical protein